MATLVLSAAGMAIGGSIGGSVLGLSAATLGRAAGAAIGRRIDQQILGSGSEPIETGRIDRFRLTGASEGAAMQQVYGRMRIAGQVIWSSQFFESSKTSGGGKGSAPTPSVTEFSYTVSMGIALCEGTISRVGRVWADGQEVAPGDLNMRVYQGTSDQQPDPKIVAVEGIDYAPAYRGTAYVVFEDLPLAQFGNRIPQFTFEVMRPAPQEEASDELHDIVQGVALMPGTGEYALATTPVYLSAIFGEQLAINTNTPMGGTDFTASLDALEEELPHCKSVVLVVSWFGDDLRCADCTLRPKVEQKDADAASMPWRVAGLTRATADLMNEYDGKPVYGGTPTDASVIEAIQDMKLRGQAPVFYPFILMEQTADNTLPDPWSGGVGQPALPWRGRITTSAAPGHDTSPDGTIAAELEVAAFMGSAAVSDFSISGTRVNYDGAADWGYRRFILHYAHLCKAAGGVAAFCIGSEMRSLTQIRGAEGRFPAVTALRALAADVRSILGPDCKISYAADWSEYHGYQPAGTGDKYFHLDPLWADENIDFIGVDNYMPLADWRDGDSHADYDAQSIYNIEYLKGNVAGGEGFDWYYPTPEARDAQRRVPITDGEGEPWLWRYKDIQGWWLNAHHNRIAGVRQTDPTAWVPQSKPFWFTELGCAALDKGANEPNKFLDPKSSESQLPHYSNGNRDDFMQMQYLRAIHAHFRTPENNPVSFLYGDTMVATDRMHVWAWDARPYPFFPGNVSLWSDGENYARGHWLNGRATNRALASVVAEICYRSGVEKFDVSSLYGVVRGYTVGNIGTARSALQPLMMTFGFEAIEREGTLVFQNRTGRISHVVVGDQLAIDSEADRSIALTRTPAAETASRIQLGFLNADSDYEAVSSETIHPDQNSFGVEHTEVALALTRNEGNHTVSRWIQEARIGRDKIEFALPPSRADVHAGDVITMQNDEQEAEYRIDRVDELGLRLIEATRIDAQAYIPQWTVDDVVVLKPFVAPVPVELLFLDLPLLTGDELPASPHVAVAGKPWPGTIALYDAAQDSDYALRNLINDPSSVGITQNNLMKGPAGIWHRQSGLEVQFIDGALSSVEVDALLSGANTLAIGDGSAGFWEVVQFRDATVVGADRYLLSSMLRGQAGTRGLIPDVWPSGSKVVLLDGTPTQIQLPTASRSNTRHFRYGPATKTIADASYRYDTQVVHGIGLRPYPVAHLRAKEDAMGADVSWIRCSRIDGDLWADSEIPLGEESEAYTVRVIQNGLTVREVTVSKPLWRYDRTDMLADIGTDAFRLEVAQVSARFGNGLFSALTMQHSNS